MKAVKPEAYRARREHVDPFEINIASYKLGDRYHCTVDNVSPGAVLARSEGASREEAESLAVERARQLIARTRIND